MVYLLRFPEVHDFAIPSSLQGMFVELYSTGSK